MNMVLDSESYFDSNINLILKYVLLIFGNVYKVAAVLTCTYYDVTKSSKNEI